jgi:membrane protein DedA with SNARE-associated domain
MNFVEIIQEHAHHAHWFVFGGALLAGLNFPMSIDLLMIASAIIAATMLPEHTLHLFLAIWLGCLTSAWISYAIGKTAGVKLANTRLFKKILAPKRLEQIKNFYQKFGIWTFIVGRFIPFGVRNCLFMSSGMSAIPFRQFVWKDGLACTIWSSVCFGSFYALGKNIDLLYTQVKLLNALIFGAFVVTVIASFWYKKKKQASSKD